MELSLEAFTERVVPLAAPPDRVRAYYQGNEDLFAQLVGREHLLRLDDRRYRVQTRGFAALGLEVKPSFEVCFRDFEDRTTMDCQDFHFAHTSQGDLELSAQFEGAALFEPDEAGTALRCWTHAQALLRLPGAWRLVPRGVIEGVLQAMMQTALEAVTNRFVPLIQRDFAAWLRQHG